MLINAIKKYPDQDGVYYYVRKINSIHYPTDEWEHSPDISNVSDLLPRYWKYDGTNTVVEMSDAEKTAVDIAQKRESFVLENSSMYTEQVSGRFYCRQRGVWVTSDDDNYGNGYFQFAEPAGRLTEPVEGWKHQGIMVPKGDIVRRFYLSGRFVWNLGEDLEYKIVCRTPSSPATWSNGINNNAEMTSSVVYKDMFFNPTKENSGAPFTGNLTHIHRRTIDLDFEIPDDGWLTLYVRGINIVGKTNYFPATFKYEIITLQ